MKLSCKLHLALLTASALYAIPITRGEHPNLDAQFEQSGNFQLAAELGRQFPQYNIVWQDPFVGLFSPADPAQWAIWTRLVPPGIDPFASGLGDAPCANGLCVLAQQNSVVPPAGGGNGPGAVIPPVVVPPGNGGGPETGPGPGTVVPPLTPPGGGTGPTDPNAMPLPGSIPEPGTIGMLVTGLSLTALGIVFRKR